MAYRSLDILKSDLLIQQLVGLKDDRPMKKITILTITILSLAISAWGKATATPMTISPNDFQGTDAERINQAIQAGAEKGLTVVISRFNKKADATTELWLLDEAILVQENTVLELNNCHLKLSDRCRDNFIRSANCGLGITDIKPVKNVHIYGVGNVLLEGADRPRSTGDSAKTLGKRSYGSDAGKEGLNQTGDWRNIGILMAYVENFSIKNLTIKNSHCWAISLERCGLGQVQDIRFESYGFRMIDGKRQVTLNQDGLDLRQGCHDIQIERISGSTGDDLIALTNIALGGKGKWEEVGGEDTTMVSGLTKRDGGVDDIRNITIRDIAGYAGGHHVVRFLNAGGLKIYNVVLDGLIDTSPVRARRSKDLIHKNSTPWMEVDDWPTWEERLVRGPYIHHCSCVYGHHADVLKEGRPILAGSDLRKL